MKQFILNILLFIAIPLIIIITFDVILRNQNSIYKEKYQGALSQKDSIEILILGNSHANYGVDPSGFDLYAYNLACIQQSVYFDKRITLSLMPYLKNIKYVFISIDYHSLYYSSQQIRDIWSYYGNGIKYKNSNNLLADFSPFLFGYTPKVSISLFKKKIINKLKNKGKIIDFDVEEGVNLKDSLIKGFISYDSNNEDVFTNESYQLRANCFKFEKKDLIEILKEKKEIIEDLSNFIEILLAKNIIPIIITTPTYKDYNKHLEISAINENVKDIQNLCEKYNLKYWDFMNSDSFEKEVFYNCDHLNKTGALKFARILNDSLKNINKEHYHNIK
ncbi:MAG: hypothetical protein ACOH2V_04920 [Candidatus Saccharimonadaceae bacterium]